MTEARPNARSNAHLDARLKDGLWGLSSTERESRDAWGNTFYWAELNSPGDLPAAAALLAEHGARLCMITALTRSTYAEVPALYLEYHFDVSGATVTAIVSLEHDEADGVPTITPWFRNADWHERECAELYGLQVRDNPNPNRLFLDPSLEVGVLRQIVPLTVMMNGACTRDLWERVMLANQEDRPEDTTEHGSPHDGAGSESGSETKEGDA